ncbi:protein-export membrane protein SecF [Candidatus Woesebacteria bacterium GWA1_41_8]|jgi:preprotein translocase subunit SecF|uniref:Protein-export membrane protein SecF n=1 Tax=Candidatus Woesebacteria bacterium GWA1_41_8 TaxID=1802471 RepID=A0A1F7WHN9_9BACT|nr:MAG: protein-export membrane protein SecF [Candidatus Woesebacteria bacterium GWA1_41_8]
MIDWMKYKWLYFSFSGFLIFLGIFSLLKWGLNLGVDFTGGSILEYKFEQTISTEEATKKLEDLGIQVQAVQTTADNSYLFRLPPISKDQKDSISTSLDSLGKGNANELRFENVGPSIGPELIQKTIYAIIISSGTILLWVAYQFKSLKYGASAIVAMFHDTFNLVGLYTLLGHFWGAEVDFLFVTALLTTLSFSVHDTIVVYDRIRETHKKEGGQLYYLANRATSETMVRSLNNSFTIMFMLLALILLGGTTTIWFAIALFIGTILGTYSSPFVAAPLLVTWDQIEQKMKQKRKK